MITEGKRNKADSFKAKLGKFIEKILSTFTLLKWKLSGADAEK
jgi:hypothetical protein